MATNVEVMRGQSENSLGALRRFTKRVQGSGVLPKVRSLRYSGRKLSYFKIKKAKLERLRRKEERDLLIKLGKISDKPVMRGRRA